jgi:hypothetical protein
MEVLSTFIYRMIASLSTLSIAIGGIPDRVGIIGGVQTTTIEQVVNIFN